MVIEMLKYVFFVLSALVLNSKYSFWSPLPTFTCFSEFAQKKVLSITPLLAGVPTIIQLVSLYFALFFVPFFI